MTYQQILEENQQSCHVNIQEKSTVGTKKTRCSGPSVPDEQQREQSHWGGGGGEEEKEEKEEDVEE